MIKVIIFSCSLCSKVLLKERLQYSSLIDLSHQFKAKTFQTGMLSIQQLI